MTRLGGFRDLDSEGSVLLGEQRDPLHFNWDLVSSACFLNFSVISSYMTNSLC